MKCANIVFEDYTSTDTSLLDSRVRLSGGTSQLNGVVQIYSGRTWLSLCNIVISTEAIPKFCEWQGYSFVQFHYVDGFCQYAMNCGHSPRTLDDCNTISEGSHFGVLIHVECIEECRGLEQIFYGTLDELRTDDGISYHGKCASFEDLFDVSLLCQNGSWKYNSSSRLCGPLDIEDVRLTDGPSDYIGRVEIQVEGQWGTVCGANANFNPASVICSMIGYASSSAVANGESFFGNGNLPIFIDDLRCDQNATDLSNCSYSRVIECDSGNVLSVSCKNSRHNSTTNSGIRLSGGLSSQDGTIEVYMEDEWLPLCFDHIDIDVAQYFCEWQGYSYLGHDVMEGACGWFAGCNSEHTKFDECNQFGRTQTTGMLLRLDCGDNDSMFQIRISNGAGPVEGIVQVNVADLDVNQNMWATLCGDMFDIETATALCKMQGLRYTYHSRRLYNGDVTTLFRVLTCPSHAAHIGTCGVHGNQCNSPVRVANLFCSDCGTADTFCGKIGSISDNGKTFSGNCDYGKSSFEVHMMCKDRTWQYTDTSRTCTKLDIDDIRLVGGVRSSFGTVEIKVGGKWGTICGRSYDIENYADYNVSEHEARQLCKMLGFMNDNMNFKIGTHFLNDDRPVFIDKLNCPKNATHIDNCTYSRVPECYPDDLVALYCDGSDISTRLTGESSPYNGEVEVYGWSTDSGGTNNSWTKVCGQSFNNHLATLACASLGLRLTSSRKVLFNDLEGFPLEIQCHGHETSLQECDFTACSEVTDHRPLTAVHLTCSECGLPSNFYGEILNVSTDGRIMHGQCSSGDTWFPVEMECINGSWTYTQSSQFCDKIGIDDIRLVDGLDAYAGRVEVLIDGVWGTLCGSSFGSTTWDIVFAVNVASTLCNMALNTTDYGSLYWSSAFYDTEFGPGNGPVLIDKIRCPLSGTHIDNCTYSRVPHCDKHNILSVSCEESNNVVPVLEDVRLVRGNSAYDGIPEVFVSGGWWAVMPNKINEEFATVVCSMLGKNFTALMQNDGEIEAPLFGKTPVCTGSERHVSECGVVPGLDSYVQYNTSIHVLCTECGKVDTFDGHVRDYNISSREVELICGALCPYPEYMTSICHGDGVWTTVSNCSVNCGNKAELQNGISGSVILSISGVPGTLCGDGFRAENAVVMCSQYRWHQQESYFVAENVDINESSLVDTVYNFAFHCKGTETNLFQCVAMQLSSCKQNSVMVQCLTDADATNCNSNIMDVRLSGGSGPLDGRLEVFSVGGWGVVDQRLFTKNNDGQLVCSAFNSSFSGLLYQYDSTEERVPLLFGRILTCTNLLDNCVFEPYSENLLGLGSCGQEFIYNFTYMDGQFYRVLNDFHRNVDSVHLFCTDCGIPDINGGKIVSYVSATKTLTISCGLVCAGPEVLVDIICLGNASWSDHIECYNLCESVNSVGLLNTLAGNVIMTIDGETGVLCADNFDGNALSVSCKNTLHDYPNIRSFSVQHVAIDQSDIVSTIFNYSFKCSGSELSLLECTYKRSDKCTGGSVYVKCIQEIEDWLGIHQVTPMGLRLFGGNSPYEGRLQVQAGGLWGSVDGQAFNMREGEFVCFSLKKRLTSFGSVTTENKTEFVHFTDMSCPGTDSNNFFPSYCKVTPYQLRGYYGYLLDLEKHVYQNGVQFTLLNNQLNKTNDVSIICTDCGLPTIIGGKVDAYDYSTNNLTVDCGLICTGNLFLECFDNGSWSDIANCSSFCGTQNNIDLLHFTFGEVIVRKDDIPGTLCGDGFDLNDASVICRNKGIDNGIADVQFNAEMVDVKSSVVVQTTYNVEFQCNGMEYSLLECPYRTLDRCDSNAVYVSCIGNPLNTYGMSDARLVDGNNPYSGRLEVFTMGSWATVVDSSPPSLSSGTVFCSHYDLLFSTYIIDTTREKKTKPAISSNIHCGADQLSSCWYNPYLNNGNPPGGVSYNPTYTNINGQEYKVLEEIYDHSRDIYLICTECGPISVENGEIVDISADGSVLTITCNYGSVYETLEVHCINGTWNGTSNCEIAGYPLHVRDIRLADGNGAFNGRVEILVGDTWGTICSDGFDMLDADIICQTLQRKYISFPRRAGGFLTNAFYGEGIGPVYMDRLECTAAAGDDIGQCDYVVNNTCTHSQDIAVVCHDCGPPNTFWDFDFFKWSGFSMIADCSFYRTYLGNLSMECSGNTGQNWETAGMCYEYSAPLEITNTRLVECNSTNTGRIELEVHGYWGTICADGIGLNEAHVLCRMLGYSSARNFYRNFTNPRTSGPIFVDELDCSETETSINDCSFETMHDCTHLQDIYLNCSACSTPAIPNGIANTSATIVGTVVEFVCRTKYRLEGNSVVLCQPNRTWTKYPKCVLIECDDPTPSHGQSSNADTSHGAETTISCDEGYILSGMSEIVCQYNSTWTSYPVCNIIECNEPQPEFAVISGNGTKYGDTLVVRCLEGYEPNGGTTIYCMFTGEWSKWQTCTIKDCGDPTPTGGFTNSTITTYGSAVHISCDPSFSILGSPDIVCQAAGTWSNLPMCDPSDCGKFQIPNAQVDFTEGTSAGSKAYIRCNSGYTLNGASEALCDESGSWNYELTCSLIDCGDFQISNGQVDEMTGNQFGDTMRVSCSTGYDLVGFSVIICNADGAWSNDPHCRIKDCGVPVLSVNVKVASEGTKFGSIVTFNCNEGYRLVGPQRSECGSDGRWSEESPVCIAKVNIGGMCAGDDYCAAKGAECLNEECKCPKTGIYDPVSNTCDTMPEFPYGEDNGDTILNTNAQCSQAVRFEPGIPVSDELHTRIFVCANGYITLGEAYASPSPPNDLDSIASKIILGPFYAVMAPSGFVYYRKYDILTSPTMRSSEDVLLLEDIIHKYGEEDNFEAKFVLFVTWKDKRPYQSIFKENSICTFQLALATDGWNTFVLFSYPKDKMNWSVQRTQKVDVWIGISVRGKKLFIDQYSNTPPVLQTDKTAATKDLRGAILKRLSDVDSVLQNHAMECIDWYTETKYKTIEIIDISSRLPDCPCNTFSLGRDPWFTLNWRWWWWGNIDCIDILPSERFSPYGKECCYDTRSGLWISDEFPQAGGLYHHHPRTFPKEHIKTDSGPKDSCCVKSDFCHLYYELHPVGDCYRESWFNFGFFWGDPHIRTLDGKTFIFNGLGEYVLLMIRNNKTDVDLQARTKRAVKADGSLSQATIFTAFAAKDNFGARFHVELNTTDDGLVLYGNGADLTERFGTETPFSFFPTGGNISMYRENNTLKIAFIESDLSFEITFGVGMLSLNAIVGKQYKGKTLGLLGNFDDNPDNDFVTPDNVVLAPNISESSIFQYGQSWEVIHTNSAFIYKDNEDHQTYQKNSFTPKFLSDADPEIVQNAIETCGEENIACIFDLVFTEDKSVAENTLERDMKSIELKVDNEKRTPKLKTCGSVWIHPGEATSCSIVYDEDTVEISIMDYNTTVANNVTLSIDKTEKTLSISAAGDSPSFDIRMTARNVDNMWSPIATVVVHYCTGCSEHGVCSNATRVDARNTDLFKYMACVCEEQFNGTDCEDDFDGCASSPCSLGRACSDIYNHSAGGSSYTCGGCPSGYIVDNNNCADINECQTNVSVCEQDCVNTDGSFQCSCNSGYRLSGNSRSCSDINECEEARHNCTQVCVNNDGGFVCTCHSGFLFNETLWDCTIDTDYDLCLSADLDCRNTSGCTLNLANETTCFCEDGFELDATGQNCKDVNECNRGVCQQVCSNTVGEFECSCYQGYRIDGKTECIPCESPYFGINCSSQCACSSRGTKECNSVRGCVCEVGWKGKTCDDDVNECEDNPNICADPLTRCKNTEGSYFCQCITGYQKMTNGTCTDINECQIGTHNCSQQCVNNVGSYSCECLNGYTRNGDLCDDIDECALGTSGCKQICENVPGQFNCFCYFGYELNSDRKSCIKISDPCLTLFNLTCEHYCVITDNNAQCRCEPGYELGTDQHTCIDINECQIDERNLCGQKEYCRNLIGSFRCECSIGWKLENDGRTCSECDAHHYGINCTGICTCINGVCHKERGCECNNGWTGTSCKIDLNECETDHHDCAKYNDASRTCVNTPGSFSCECRAGYHTVGGLIKCADVDECSDPRLNDCDQICENTDGDYTCSCHDGYQFVDGSCQDIDECKIRSSCEHLCENFNGGFRCSCFPGYNLNLTNRHSCIDVNECNQVSLNLCGQKDNCRNSEGSFSCFCSPGWKLEDNGRTCAECDGNHFGESCSKICNCVHGVCDRISGCMCESGWEGDSCRTDVDECGFVDCTDQHPNTLCVNTDGGYTCNCKEGFNREDDYNLCHDINECSETLHDCDQICLNVEGSFECNCFDGFTRNNNSCKDINECLDTSVCDQNCFNIIGGYNCSCEKGFTLTDDNKTCSAITECNGEETADCPEKSTCAIIDAYPVCVCDNGYSMTEISICEDINECESGTTPCTQGCTNFPGGFSCTCEVGYSLLDDRVTCEECESWRYGENCTESCDCDKARSCDKATGECDCKQGWLSAKCDEDINECENGSLFDCKDHSFCVNTDGGYLCVCERGYQQTEDETCSECPEWSFGYGCKKQCACNKLTSATCHHGTGECTCIEGWTGNECSEDVNECVETPDICDNTANTRCVNVDATYHCECKDGYTDVSGLCADIDECLEDPCNQECTNTDGSYYCYCNPGFTEQNNVCTPCTDNTFGTNCSEACNCELSNVLNASQLCDTVNGTCLCNQFWTGVTCNDDINECLIPSTCANRPNTGCHNTRGGFICDCKRGYRLENSICVLENQGQTTETPTAESFGVRRTVRIDYLVPDGTDFEVSATFTEFKEKIKRALRDLFTSYTAKPFTIVIHKISAVSLIVNFTVLFDDNNVDKNDKAAIAKAFVDLNAGKEIVVDGATFAANLVEDGVSDACDVYVEIIGNCAEGQTCRVANGDAVCSDETSPGTNIALVVGLIIGCSVLVLVGVLTALCIRKLRSESNQRKNGTSRSRGVSGRMSIPGDQIGENFASMRIERSRPRNENF